MDILHGSNPIPAWGAHGCVEGDECGLTKRANVAGASDPERNSARGIGGPKHVTYLGPKHRLGG